MPTISYNTLFSEACSEGKIVDYFLKMRNVKADETDRNKIFIYEIAELSEYVLEKIKDVQNKRVQPKEGETKMNYILIVVVLLAAGIGVYYYIKNKQNQELEETIEMDDKTYTLERMTAFVKQRLNEITKVNLYDIGLSEEELKRRKNKKYELKKALKGCTYGDVNDKKYIKELIYDLLYREYGVDETNVSKAIPFDIPSLLTAQDKLTY